LFWLFIYSKFHYFKKVVLQHQKRQVPILYDNPSKMQIQNWVINDHFIFNWKSYFRKLFHLPAISHTTEDSIGISLGSPFLRLSSSHVDLEQTSAQNMHYHG